MPMTSRCTCACTRKCIAVRERTRQLSSLLLPFLEGIRLGVLSNRLRRSWCIPGLLRAAISHTYSFAVRRSASKAACTTSGSSSTTVFGGCQLSSEFARPPVVSKLVCEDSPPVVTAAPPSFVCTIYEAMAISLVRYSLPL
ncbi:hypothetical protein MRX96_019297 [Rhipicephalus microplus]